ncbi:MAG: hypothetical protein KY391_05410 [Actinobacteria bacterium]|nr:hypothetical protein [Actinomycetota bacterium]
MADGDNVVPLPGDPPPPEPAVPPSPPGRLHGAAIAGMGISAIVGVAAMLAFITVTWPEDVGRVVIGVCLFSGLAFLTFASTAVFTAARDTYRDDTARKEPH